MRRRTVQAIDRQFQSFASDRDVVLARRRRRGAFNVEERRARWRRR